MILKASGKPVNFLRCDDGTTQCAYDRNQLRPGGQPLNADPVEEGGDEEAAFVHDEDGTPVRIGSFAQIPIEHLDRGRFAPGCRAGRQDSDPARTGARH